MCSTTHIVAVRCQMVKLTSSKYNKLSLKSSVMMKYDNIQSQGQANSNFTCNGTESFIKECNYIQEIHK